MANIRKTFNFRNGVQVDEDNFIVDSLGKVGIGTTVPSQFIDCRGNAKVVGILTSQSLETRNVNIAGVTTFSGNTHVGSAITMYPAAGIISATQIHGDGRNLINIPTSQWTDIDVGLGLTSIYNDGFVGVSTNDPRFTLQVGGNNVLSNFQNGVGINSSGNIIATGVITATNFRGDLSGPGGVPAQVTGNLIGNINSTGVSTVTGLGVTNLSVSGVSTFKDDVEFHGVSGIASAFWDKSNNRLELKDNVLLTFGETRDLQISHNGTDSIIKDAGVGRLKILGGFEVKNVGDTQTLITANTSGASATNVELYYGNVKRLETSGVGVTITSQLDTTNLKVSGIITAVNAKVSTKLDLGGVSSQGISTSTPQSELHVFNSGISSVLIESGSNESVVTLGRNTNGQTSGAIRYGNKSAGFPYSNENALDFVNYDTGNVNFYLSAGTTGGQGDFVWHYRANNTRLMALTGIGGSLGIGVTDPQHQVHVSGGCTFSGNSFFGSNVDIAGSINIKGVGNLVLPSGVEVGGAGLVGDVLAANNDVVFDNGLTLGSAQSKANTYVTTGISTFSAIISQTIIGISTDNIDINQNGEGTGALLGVGADDNRRFVVDNEGKMGIGTAIPKCDADFAGIGKTDANFMRLPTHSTTSRNNLESTTILDGALIYNTTLKKIQFHDGTSWKTVTST